MDKTTRFLAAVFVLVSVFAALRTTFTDPSEQQFGVALPSSPAVFETSLQDRISESDTSLTLVSTTTSSGETVPIGAICLTVDEGRSEAEFMCGTLGGSKTVSGLSRGLSYITGTTTVSANAHDHRKGANVKISDFPVIQRMKAQLNGEDTIANLLNYTNVQDYTNASGTALVDLNKLQQTSFNGTVDTSETVKGISEIATAAEIAAGTQYGATGAPLVVPNERATTTPTASCSVSCIVAAAAGKISQSFLDLTTSYAWSGAHTFSSATTTMSGNVSIAATGANPFRLNSLFYRFPATHGASSTVLSQDGSGNLAWVDSAYAKLLADSTSYCTTSTATTTVKLLTVTSGRINSNTRVHITGAAMKTINGATANGFYSIQIGNGSATSTLVNDAIMPNSPAGIGAFDLWMFGTGALTSQMTYGNFTYSNALTLYSATSSANLSSQWYIAFALRAGSASDTWCYRGVYVDITSGD